MSYADIPRSDWQWRGSVKVTTPWRTLLDLIAQGIDPDLFTQAVDQAAERGLIPADAWRALVLALVTKGKGRRGRGA